MCNLKQTNKKPHRNRDEIYEYQRQGMKEVGEMGEGGQNIQNSIR